MGAIWHQSGAGTLTCTWLVHARTCLAARPFGPNRQHGLPRSAAAPRPTVAGSVSGLSPGGCCLRACARPDLARTRIAVHDRTVLPRWPATFCRDHGPQGLPRHAPCMATTTHHAMLMVAIDAACLARSLALRSRTPAFVLPAPQQLGKTPMRAACPILRAALAPGGRERIAPVSPRRLSAVVRLCGRAALAAPVASVAAVRGDRPWPARAGAYAGLWLPASRGAAFCGCPRGAAGVGAWVRGGRRVCACALRACRRCVFRVFLGCFVTYPSLTPRTNGPPSLFMYTSCMTSCPGACKAVPDRFPG